MVGSLTITKSICITATMSLSLSKCSTFTSDKKTIALCFNIAEDLFRLLSDSTVMATGVSVFSVVNYRKKHNPPRLYVN